MESEAILTAAPSYLARRGTPRDTQDLLQHDCLRLTPAGLRNRPWRLFRAEDESVLVDLDVKPVLWANHPDALLRAAIDGAGITATTTELAAPHLASGALVRVLNPWIANRYTVYAALPSRKFLPQRTRVFMDYLIEKTRLNVANALLMCGDGC